MLLFYGASTARSLAPGCGRKSHSVWVDECQTQNPCQPCSKLFRYQLAITVRPTKVASDLYGMALRTTSSGRCREVRRVINTGRITSTITIGAASNARFSLGIPSWISFSVVTLSAAAKPIYNKTSRILKNIPEEKQKSYVVDYLHLIPY